MPAEPETPDERVTFTAEELREMETEGLTLDDAIRVIEAKFKADPATGDSAVRKER